MAQLGRCIRVDDPRDCWGKMTRWQLFKCAQALGVKEIIHEMPATLMRDVIRAKGFREHHIPKDIFRPQGLPQPPEQPVPEVNANADLLRQFMAQQSRPPEPAAKPAKRVPAKVKPQRLVERPRQEINVLRDKCKELGIKMDRRDTKEKLKEKIAAHSAPQQTATQ